MRCSAGAKTLQGNMTSPTAWNEETLTENLVSNSVRRGHQAAEIFLQTLLRDKPNMNIMLTPPKTNPIWSIYRIHICTMAD